MTDEDFKRKGRKGLALLVVSSLVLFVGTGQLISAVVYGLIITVLYAFILE